MARPPPPPPRAPAASSSAPPHDKPSSRQALADRVLQAYTARTPAALLAALEATHRPDAAFCTPVVAVSGRPSIALQFYQLQRMFSGVDIQQRGSARVVGEAAAPGQLEVQFEFLQRLVFSVRRPRQPAARLLAGRRRACAISALRMAQLF